MDKVTLIDHHFIVHQSITIGNAQSLCQEGCALLVKAQAEMPLYCDLAALSTIDSAGIAVLMCWQHAAAYRLRFTNIPNKLRQLAQAAQLEELLFEGIAT